MVSREPGRDRGSHGPAENHDPPWVTGFFHKEVPGSESILVKALFRRPSSTRAISPVFQEQDGQPFP
jgi:hypothetical protein